VLAKLAKAKKLCFMIIKAYQIFFYKARVFKRTKKFREVIYGKT